MLLKTFKDKTTVLFKKTTVKSEYISADFALLVKKNKSFKNITLKYGLNHLMVQGPNSLFHIKEFYIFSFYF